MKLRALFFATVALVTVTAACSKPSDAKPEGAAKDAPKEAAKAPAAPAAADGRRVDITVTNEGYAPAVIDAKKGESLVLRFTRTTKAGCVAQVVFPGLKITKDLPLDTPVDIPIKADKAGKIPFECGMAMVHGTVNVSES